MLHAICGLASLYTPVTADPELDRARTMASVGWRFTRIIPGVYLPDNGGGKPGLPTTVFDVLEKGTWEEGFGAAHIRLASRNLTPSVRVGDRLLQMLQGSRIFIKQ